MRNLGLSLLFIIIFSPISRADQYSGCFVILNTPPQLQKAAGILKTQIENRIMETNPLRLRGPYGYFEGNKKLTKVRQVLQEYGIERDAGIEQIVNQSTKSRLKLISCDLVVVIQLNQIKSTGNNLHVDVQALNHLGTKIYVQQYQTGEKNLTLAQIEDRLKKDAPQIAQAIAKAWENNINEAQKLFRLFLIGYSQQEAERIMEGTSSGDADLIVVSAEQPEIRYLDLYGDWHLGLPLLEAERILKYRRTYLIFKSKKNYFVHAMAILLVILFAVAVLLGARQRRKKGSTQN